MASILVVDDEEVIRVAFGRILERAGHELCFASNGEEALRLCLRRDIDVVLTDLEMPRGDGMELIEGLQGLIPPVPIVAMSGRQPHLLAFAQSAGAHSVLAKPINAQDLIDAIEDAMKPSPDSPE